ncbi:MAG: hypothetical protein R3F30_06125 [Planctomycetota bacterium]
MHKPLLLPLCTLLLSSVAGAPACIWDSDTLGDELHGLPDALRLVTGRWHRHGKAYYEARIRRLPERLEAHPDDLDAYDDLAVAHERLGDRDAALAVIERKKKALDARADKDAVWKRHLYRYHANKGTFLAHSGRFDAAVAELERALEIDPAAHFGRERYQVDLIRYVAACREDRGLWAREDWMLHTGVMPEKGLWSVTGPMSFSAKPRSGAGTRKVDWTELYTAVAGMLRFGGLEGPELYRSMGDLFLARRDLHLAWWSYMVAIERGHPARAQCEAACAGIVKHWKEANRLSGQRTPIPTREEFVAVRRSANQWLAKFQSLEAEAIAEGKDPADPELLARLLAAADEAEPEVLPEAARHRNQGEGAEVQRGPAKGGPVQDAHEAPPRSEGGPTGGEPRRDGDG